MLLQEAFLPSMPDDMQAVAQEALGPLQWYRKSTTGNVSSCLKYVQLIITFTLIFLSHRL